MLSPLLLVKIVLYVSLYGLGMQMDIVEIPTMRYNK